MENINWYKSESAWRFIQGFAIGQIIIIITIVIVIRYWLLETKKKEEINKENKVELKIEKIKKLNIDLNDIEILFKILKSIKDINKTESCFFLNSYYCP